LVGPKSKLAVGGALELGSIAPAAAVTLECIAGLVFSLGWVTMAAAPDVPRP